MKKEDQDQIRTKLLQQREEVVEVMGERREQDAAGAGDGLDPIDRAEAEIERGIDHRILMDDNNLLGKIDMALERLDAGTYENCAVCGKEIPMERLLAKPSVSLCVKCQEVKERGGDLMEIAAKRSNNP